VSPLRHTRQREAIWRTLMEAGRPLSPREILSESLPRVDNLGIATVYRAVKALTEEGRLVAVDIPGRPVHYERAGLDHHHHFCCTRCERVFELEGCALAREPKTPRGFKVEAHEVTLYGICRECRS
jgi:Fur family ferric uptake transcriptional regulator